MIDWNTFRKRRQLNVDAWFVASKITSYDDFCKVLCGLGVTPPGVEVYQECKPKFAVEDEDELEIKLKIEHESKPKRQHKKSKIKLTVPVVDGDELCQLEGEDV